MIKKKGKKIIIEDEVTDGETPESKEIPGETTQPEADPDSSDEKSPEPLDVGETLQDDSIPLEVRLDLVQAAWEASEAKAIEYLEGWQREKAEFVNYKKRILRDREQFEKDAVGRVVRNYLPVVDDLGRALRDGSRSGEGEAWASGIELIYRKLLKTLENDGVTPIEAEGQIFDPNLHEAVAQVPSPNHQSGQVIDILQIGYKIGERVLRPARVAIAE